MINIDNEEIAIYLWLILLLLLISIIIYIKINRKNVSKKEAKKIIKNYNNLEKSIKESKIKDKDKKNLMIQIEDQKNIINHWIKNKMENNELLNHEDNYKTIESKFKDLKLKGSQ